MSRILVLATDVLPFPGFVTTGSGLRAWAIGQALEERGHEIGYAFPRRALQAEQADPDSVPENAIPYEYGEIDGIVRAVAPDCVVAFHWPLVGKIEADVPIAVDLCGPHLLELSYQGHDLSEMAKMKVTNLARADFVFTSGEYQRHYFLPWLMLAGHDVTRELIPVVPYSMPPRRPPPTGKASDLTFVYGGLFLPWQDPSVGLRVLLDELGRRDRGRLRYFGGRHPFYDVPGGVHERLSRQLEKHPRVLVRGLVPFAELVQVYTGYHVALDLMARNPERELAFTTRTMVYMWCGLPVIYNNYSELGGIIESAEAGWCVDPGDEDAIRAVLEEIFGDVDGVLDRGRKAQNLVMERYTWDRTIAPVLEFVERPRRERRGSLWSGRMSRRGWRGLLRRFLE